MKESILSRIDWLSLFLYFFLLGFGLLNIYSSTYSEISPSLISLSNPIGKQLLFTLISVFVGGFLLAFKVKFLNNLRFLSMGLLFFYYWVYFCLEKRFRVHGHGMSWVGLPCNQLSSQKWLLHSCWLRFFLNFKLILNLSNPS